MFTPSSSTDSKWQPICGGTLLCSLHTTHSNPRRKKAGSIITTGIALALLAGSAQAASRSIFNSDFNVITGGAIIASDTGDLFRLGASMTVTDPNFSLWDTRTATLEFFKGTKNTTGNHSLLYAGLDLGPTYAPLLNAEDTGYIPNLAWGEVVINAGNRLLTGGGALYTDRLTFSGDLSAITAQIATFTGDMKIYYNPLQNPMLEGLTFAFAPGSNGAVVPISTSLISQEGSSSTTHIPEPSAVLLISAGTILLGGWRRRF